MTFSPLVPPSKAPIKFSAVASIVTKPNKSVLAAVQSWRVVGKSVFLFNSPNDLGGDVNNVSYVTANSYPCCLKEVLGKLADETYPHGVGVLVKEDVFIQPEAIQAIAVSAERSLGNAWAATSRAKEYHPVSYASTGAFAQIGVSTDYQCFITTNSAWRAMEKACPKSIHAGTPEAFEWVANFCSTHIQQNRYHDIEAISPFWRPQKKVELTKPDSGKQIKGPQRRYI